MLLTHEKFKGFSPNPVSDARKQTEVLICLSCESREAVDPLVKRAVTAGGRTYNEEFHPELPLDVFVRQALP